MSDDAHAALGLTEFKDYKAHMEEQAEMTELSFKILLERITKLEDIVTKQQAILTRLQGGSDA